MPFSKEFDDVYEAIKEACEECARRNEDEASRHPQRELLAGLSCTRIDREPDPDIMKALLEHIHGSGLCVGDLSFSNKNVLWEVGYAMALSKPVLLITQTPNEISFNLRNIRNHKYERNDLGSLKKKIIEEIEAIFRAPEAFACPTDPLHARTLVMSIASPTYFLDADWNIRYMNEAAASIFSSRQAPTSWHGRSLGDFMNHFVDRLENLPEIERNLQLQKEQIKRLATEDKASAILPYNIERVILRTERYGTLELQKTGVAVRDASSADVLGWVVSFSVMNAREPGKFSQFFVRHQNIVEGRLFADVVPATKKATGKTGKKSSPPATPQSAIVDLLEKRHIKLRHPEDYEEEQDCFEFSAEIMREDPRYGLQSVEYLDDWFFDYRNTDFLMMVSPDEEHLCAVLRLHRNHDLRNYANLNDSVKQLVADGAKFADAGAYFPRGITPQTRVRCLAMLLGAGAFICEQRRLNYIYAQVPAEKFGTLNRCGWEQVGSEFECRGWAKKAWIPVLLDPKLYGPNGDGSGCNAEFVAMAREGYALYEAEWMR